jgi:aryl-alcohol dehydrogenase-like predicted oxidoreductase
MTALCQEQNIELLAHGTLLGGLLTDYWLRRRDPGLDALATAAEKKYYPEVLAWGRGRLTHWKQHQALLAHCREVADKHSVSVSNVTATVCMRYVQCVALCDFHSVCSVVHCYAVCVC